MSTEAAKDHNISVIGRDLTPADEKRMVGRVVVIQKDQEPTANPGATKTIEDPFEEFYGEGVAVGVVRPPINLLELSQLWERSTILGQCVEAMEVNTEAVGYRFVPRLKNEAVTPELKRRMQVEETILDNFFNYASVDEPELSFTDLRRRKRRDQESTGNAFWEVLRNPAGEMMGFNIIPAHTCRLSKISDEVETKQKLLLKTPEGGLVYRERTVWRRFRKVAQIRAHKVAWFKQLGDPRIIDVRTGEVADDSLEMRWRANEVIHFKCVWSSRSPYAFPRHIGNLFSVYGSRSAEEINYFTFENNNIPSMAILVSNGMLTDGSIDRIREFVESQISGKKNYSQFLILESEPVGEGVANPGTMKMDIKPLTDVQLKDELFQNYDKNNRAKVRGAFRLPPIYLGLTEDYNRATAQVAKSLADEQVFNPERNTFDEFMNRVILPELGIMCWKFKSNTPDTTDNETLIKMLTAAEKSGGLTPQIARDVMSDIFSRDLGKVEGIDPIIPFSIQLAQSMKSNGNPQSALSIPGSAAAARDSSGLTKARELVKLRQELEQVYKSAYDEMWDQLDPVMPEGGAVNVETGPGPDGHKHMAVVEMDTGDGVTEFDTTGHHHDVEDWVVQMTDGHTHELEQPAEVESAGRGMAWGPHTGFGPGPHDRRGGKC